MGFGDVNGDGFADLVTRDRLTAELKVGLSNGTGFAALAPWGNWPGAGRLAPLRLADVDGDLLEDLVVRDAPTDSVYVARSTGAAFAAPSLWGNVSAGPEFTAADANGDGSADAVGRDPVTGAVRVGGSAFFEGEGEARFDTATAWLAAVAGELRSGDADGDGASDIISREQSGQLRVTPSSTMDFAGGGVWGSLPTDHELVTGDVDGDGTVDAVGRSSTNSDVRVAASTATAFEPSERVGTFSSAYTVDLADANGDGREDVLGRNPLTGDVAVALSGVPGVPGPDAGDWTPDPEIAYDDATDLLFDNPSGGTAAAAAPAPARMQLGFEDPARLLFRMNLGTPGDPFDGGEGERLANARIDLIYSRIRAAGARMVRFNVYWGAYENADGSFEFAKLGKAVDRARANGMRVYVSLGGLTAPGGECLKVGPGRVLPYNGRARTCTDDPAHNVCGAPGTAPAQQTEATGVAPDPGCYARFVRAAVAYLGERVNAYSIWNEPNVRTFLRTADPRSQRVVPADLYRELYVQGRAAVKAANPDAKVMIGELSYLPRKPARYTPGGPLVRDGVSAPDFLYRVASSPLATDGVAWHPYQHSAWPTKAGPKGKVGIGKVDLTQDRIDGLFNKQAPCSSRLYRPPLQRGGRCTRPGLLYTEFGYFARNPKPTIYHTESRRAGMFKAALGRALRNDVKWMSIYHATEAADLTGIDYGVFASDGEVRGQRSTGKGPRPGYDNPQQRRAYCDGIRAFGIAERYPIESAPC